MNPDMSGICTKIHALGDPPRDFVIKNENKGLFGFINLIGIESLGLITSPAITIIVADIVNDYLN